MSKMKVIVKDNRGESTIIIHPEETFLELKERVEEQAGISLDLREITGKGSNIPETQSVVEYFLFNNVCVEEATLEGKVVCAVPGCSNTKLTHPHKTFFQFPTDEIRCYQWVRYCQRLSSEPGKTRLNLTSESTICSDHFRQDQFVKNTNTLLKRTAVPFMPMENTTTETDFDESDGSGYFLEEFITTDFSQDSLCRLCALANDDFIMIFDEFGRQLKLAEKINLCLPIQVSITDGLPKQICRLCCIELDELFDLADVVSLAQNKLIDMADDKIVNELTLLSLDETGEELVVGSSTCGEYDEDVVSSRRCPLCTQGTMHSSNIPQLVAKQEFPEEIKQPSDDEEDIPNSIFCAALNEIGTFDLNSGESKTDSFDKSDTFSENYYSDGSSNEKCVDPLGSVKSYGGFYFKCDAAELVDTQLGSSTGRDFKETDLLKFDEGSRSDCGEISESLSYCSSLVSSNPQHPDLNVISEKPSSPLDQHLQIGTDIYSLHPPHSQSDNPPYLNESPTKKHDPQDTEPVDCRICGYHFLGYHQLEKHSLHHSYPGFYQCSACVKFFFSRAELSRHYNTHKFPEIDILFCDSCSKTFISSFALATHVCKQEYRPENHMKLHNGTRKAHCTICDKDFDDDNKLRKHSMYTHSILRSHCCEDCGKSFKSEASMRYHQRCHQIEEGIKGFNCDRCGKSFVRKSMLLNHLSSSHPSFQTSSFICKICSEAFPTTDAAVSHMENNHTLECMEKQTYSFEMLTISKIYVCEYCERCFAESGILNTHRSRHNPDDSPYQCIACHSTFPSSELLEKHRKENCDEMIPPEYLVNFSIPLSFLCEFCDRCFLNQTKYNEHLTVHFGAEPYQCRHCTEKFSSLAEVMDHRSSLGHLDPPDDHNLYRPYECHYCNKSFAIEDALSKHIRMHTGEKPFKCEQCGKRFSQSSGLYTHQKVHSSLRPYTCTLCPRTFKIKGDRDVHLRKHSGDRPYKCEFCGKAFMTQHVYSQHRKIHTGERPYKCDVCGIAFRRSHVLTVHKRIHTGEKPNICDICGKRYRQKGDMLKHKRIQHGQITSKPIITNQLFF